MIKLAPSILSADFGCLAEQLAEVEKAGAHLIHVDVMDGHFVPNITIGPVVVEGVKKHTTLPLDVHLMIDKPGQYIEAFRVAGADIITFHVEAVFDILKLVNEIKALGAKAGVAISPETPVNVIKDVITELDMLTVMSVHPGFGGQKFIGASIPKIETVRRLAEASSASLEIEVDGGINLENAASVAAAGADVLVAGAALFHDNEPGLRTRKFLETLRKV